MAGVTLNVAAALLPVLLFLALLVLLDSFKLLSLRSVLLALTAGAAAALLGARLNVALLDASGLSTTAYSRYAAPLVEELLKAVWFVVLLRRGRVGFLVDAAILGFAIGAGFALVENVEYLRAMAEPRVLLWLVRGFGTALLHGATTAILAMIAKSLIDRRPLPPALAVVAGLLAAAAIHSAYNHFFLPPVAAAAVLLVAVPLLVVFVFDRSERATREWLGTGIDSDLEIVESIVTGRFLETRLGGYLRSLQARFPGEVVADMLCLVRLQAELSIRAKGLLLAREAGLDAPVGEDVRASLQELRYLETSMGPTGRLALKPLFRERARAAWQVFLLEEAGGSASRASAR
ncbi:MAG: PrsW family glutamic-type intramembrane protease [Vicinamibacteria bacterium]